MSADQCWRLDGTDRGRIPDDYPLQLGAIVKGRHPEATWNEADKDWVSFRWVRCANPLAPNVYAVASDFTTRTGLTLRQVHYWTARGYLQAHNPTPGTGNQLRWPAEELAVAEEMLRLVRAGVLPAAASRAVRSGGRLGVGVAVNLP